MSEPEAVARAFCGLTGLDPNERLMDQDGWFEERWVLLCPEAERQLKWTAAISACLAKALEE